jgi:hypothetical protein
MRRVRFNVSGELLCDWMHIPNDCAILDVVKKPRFGIDDFIFEVAIPGDETIEQAAHPTEVHPFLTRHTPPNYDPESEETFVWDWNLPK